MKEIKEYEIAESIVDYPDYYQGCGTAFTDFEDVATGIGQSEHEAFDDALDNLAQLGWDVWGVKAKNFTTHLKECCKEELEQVDENFNQPQHYVSIRVR